MIFIRPTIHILLSEEMMNTEEFKYQLAICSYVYNNSMPDLNKGLIDVECTECNRNFPKGFMFWVSGLVTCNNCLPKVATREAKLL